MPTPNTILIVSGPGGITPPEPIANEIIKPGHHLKYVGLHAGVQQKVGLQQSAGGSTYPLFALEADYVGTSGSSVKRIDNPYASGDRVHAYMAERGARIYAWLAQGNSVVPDQPLMAAPNGELRIGSGATVGFLAKETVNASAAAARIIVEVL